MDLSDGPPGAEGYEDTVVEVPKKPGLEETKAEKEFNDHLNSLKIRTEDGGYRSMVERRGRDLSGKWIYLCYPCAAVCSGESILQMHISGKKHKSKLALKTVWPISIYHEHPHLQENKESTKTEIEQVVDKMAKEVELHNADANDLDRKFAKYRAVTCTIQDTLDGIKAPLVGVEYLIEFSPDEPHHAPTFLCTLCDKKGQPRTIINHMTCFWHRLTYIARHFPKAALALSPFKNQSKYREGVSIVLNRLVQRIEDKYGRMRPIFIDKFDYEKEKESIYKWLFKSNHFQEKPGATFEEVVDVNLIQSIEDSKHKVLGSAPAGEPRIERKKDPSPPHVAAPKPKQRSKKERDLSESLSDISDEELRSNERDYRDYRPRNDYRGKFQPHPRSRYEPYPRDNRHPSPQPAFKSRFAIRNAVAKSAEDEKSRPPNYEHKLKLLAEKRRSIEETLGRSLAYHEKNPEKHPMYPEEWKKFWNRRYKELQAEGKDPSKHDFKPEWIVFWTARMKELHAQEVQSNLSEVYRKLRMTPPPFEPGKKSPERPRGGSPKRRSLERERPRSPAPQRRSPAPRRRSPEPRRRSPVRLRSPIPRRRSPERRRPSPVPKRRSPNHARDRRSPLQKMQDRRPSPPRPRSRSPLSRARTHITLESVSRRSSSPLSRREASMPHRNRSPRPAPSLQTVMISDDELKPDDGLSPWNSDNDMDSLGSLPEAPVPRQSRERSHAGSVVSRSSRSTRHWDNTPAPRAEPQDLGPPENIVATLRLLVALEDYLGSLGPKIINLLTEALRMEKERANSSEELLEQDAAVVLMETAKEKLKGAVQAGLVPKNAVGAVRTAMVRTAATLHEADTRMKKKPKQPASVTSTSSSKVESMPVAGVGVVDREQIAVQIATALIEQGKTDVSSEELAQLVDAVVGMAETKKKEAEITKKKEVVKIIEPSRPPPTAKAAGGGAATALQMLQSAYDENDKAADKKVDASEEPDAMDGLSDSDLETLLKSFNELSAEEQHSLIAYLKKLEAKQPERVERLRQYVSAEPPPPAASVPKKDKPIHIDSDDDDYTVEEVFHTVKKKVNEDQIRQEMEVVKKTLEESKTSENKPINVGKNFSSASDLFAMMQSSIQSTAKPVPSPEKAADVVVTSHSYPRSFGDKPENPIPIIKPAAFCKMTDDRNEAPMNRDNSDIRGPYNQGVVNEPYQSGNSERNEAPMDMNSSDTRGTYNQGMANEPHPSVSRNTQPDPWNNDIPAPGPPNQWENQNSQNSQWENRDTDSWNNRGPPRQEEPWENRAPPIEVDPWDNRAPPIEVDPWDNRGPPPRQDGPWEDKGPSGHVISPWNNRAPANDGPWNSRAPANDGPWERPGAGGQPHQGFNNFGPRKPGFSNGPRGNFAGNINQQPQFGNAPNNFGRGRGGGPTWRGRGRGGRF